MRLRNRFDELSEQFGHLLSRATLVSGEETWGSGENAFVNTWHEYEFENPQEWETFAGKWHAPYGSAHRLMRSLCMLDSCLALVYFVDIFSQASSRMSSWHIHIPSSRR